MYKIWCFSVDTNIIFPEPEYYITYKGLQFKYISRYKDKKADNLIVKYSNISDNEVYKIIAEYLNALAFKHDAFMNFEPWTQFEGNHDLKTIKYMSDEPRSYHCFDCIPYVFLVANIETEEQAQLISLYVQARTNINHYFKVLFYWHALNFPNSNENFAVDFINTHKDKSQKFYIDYIEKNPIFAENKQINKSFGDYIKWGVRHSLAHITRTKENAVSLELENLEQIRHIATIGNILRDITRYRIENVFNVHSYAPPKILNEFDPNENLLQK